MAVEGLMAVLPWPSQLIYEWLIRGFGSFKSDVTAYPSNIETTSVGLRKSNLRGSCFPCLFFLMVGVA